MTDKPIALVVDDDHINRLLLGRMLKMLDIPFEQCENGEEALKWLKDTKQSHVVVLLDLNMPVMDGYEMIDYLENNPSLFLHTQISIIVVSASEYFVFQQRCPEADIVAYIQKPISREIVQQAIHQAYANFQLK